MTLSRHTQVENLASLLGARRTQLRERMGRQAAYLNFIGAILEQPVADFEPALTIAGLAPRVASPADRPRAA